jgi:hypothetical protein
MVFETAGEEVGPALIVYRFEHFVHREARFMIWEIVVAMLRGGSC